MTIQTILLVQLEDTKAFRSCFQEERGMRAQAGPTQPTPRLPSAPAAWLFNGRRSLSVRLTSLGDGLSGLSGI